MTIEGRSRGGFPIPSKLKDAPYLAIEVSPRGTQEARGGIARCKIYLKVLIEEGALEERKRFIRNFGSIEGDGKDRKIRVGCYDPGEDVALRVMPPTGLESASARFPPLSVPSCGASAGFSRDGHA